jgi:6-pyruvoyltetrahydropterin/6-carboxytetrahydropterin synthase
MTYQVAVRRNLISQHFLIGGDWGPENELHSHPYTVEVVIEGEDLDRHGYLVDIVAIEETLTEQIHYYSDRTLNELPEFSDLNPSIEHFARILCLGMQRGLAGLNFSAITVRLWESSDAWASFRAE